MRRRRKQIYRILREIRRERDYEVGKLQYANRPYSKPPILLPGRIRQKLTSIKFINSGRHTYYVNHLIKKLKELRTLELRF